jgi:O-antigen/teichoic acid export membrane protein
LNLLRFKQSEFGRSVLKLGVGTAVGQGLVLLASPIWSRLYAPPDFALLGLFLSFINTASVALALRYDFAIPMGSREGDGPRLLYLSLLLTMPLSLVFGFVLASLIEFDALGYGALPLLAVPMAVMVMVFIGIFMSLRYWFVGGGDFGQISRSIVLQGAGRGATPILLAPLHWGWLGLIAGEVVGRAFGIGRLAKPALPMLKTLHKHVGWLELRQTAANYKRFPLVFLPSALLDAVSAAVALPLFVTLYGLHPAGQFMLAQQVVNVPSAFISAALSDVYHQKLVATARSSAASIPPMLWRSAGLILAVALLVLLPACLIAPIATPWVFGAQWDQAGIMIAILAPSTAVSIVSGALSRAFVLSRVPQVKLVSDVVKLILPMGGLVLSWSLGATAVTSVIVYSIMYGVSYAVYFLVILYAVRPSRQEVLR